MNSPNRVVIVTLSTLWLGMAVPFLYFGSQLIAAPFCPGYSFLRDMASVLGSGAAPQPWIWSYAAILQGILTVLAAFGFLRGLRALGTRPIWTWIVAGAVATNGLVSMAGGIFPLGDERHNGGPLIVGTLLLPLILAASLWKRSGARGLRIYLLASGVVVLVMAPLMGAAVEIGLAGVRGLLQRVLTLAIFPPIAVVAWRLRRDLTEAAAPPSPASSPAASGLASGRFE